MDAGQLAANAIAKQGHVERLWKHSKENTRMLILVRFERVIRIALLVFRSEYGMRGRYGLIHAAIWD